MQECVFCFCIYAGYEQLPSPTDRLTLSITKQHSTANGAGQPAAWQTNNLHARFSVQQSGQLSWYLPSQTDGVSQVEPLIQA